jgi:3-hydroxy-3-methylglutaryl CoA synthase
MVGLVSYGAYIPTYRIDRRIIADAWGRRALKGERSLANNDEDSLTMAVAASMNCLNDRSREDIDGFNFATTTAPYQEKMSASLIATALDCARQIPTCDFGNSLRSGTAALRAAHDAVKCGATTNHLVVAADQRSAYPKSDEEQTFGDGAAAVVIGSEDVVATIEGQCAINNEMLDVWRKPGDPHINMWEGRFVQSEGYTAHIEEVIRALLDKYALNAEDISKVILPAPSERLITTIARAFKFDANTQLQDALLSNVGYCGCAQPLMMLCHAIEQSKPGDLLLLTAYGDGADAFLFKVTEKVTEKVHRYGIETLLQNKLMLPAYGRFLSYKDIVTPLPGEPFRLMPSATASWRERNSVLRCHASKCLDCGCVSFPIQRICYECKSKDKFEHVRLSDQQGKIFTFTRDNIAGRSDDPVVVQTVAEFDEGARFYGLMTDCDPSEVELDQAVELTFRRFYEGAGFHNYFWKLRPMRTEKGD